MADRKRLQDEAASCRDTPGLTPQPQGRLAGNFARNFEAEQAAEVNAGKQDDVTALSIERARAARARGEVWRAPVYDAGAEEKEPPQDLTQDLSRLLRGGGAPPAEPPVPAKDRAALAARRESELVPLQKQLIAKKAELDVARTTLEALLPEGETAQSAIAARARGTGGAGGAGGGQETDTRGSHPAAVSGPTKECAVVHGYVHSKWVEWPREEKAALIRMLAQDLQDEDDAAAEAVAAEKAQRQAAAAAAAAAAEQDRLRIIAEAEAKAKVEAEAVRARVAAQREQFTRKKAADLNEQARQNVQDRLQRLQGQVRQKEQAGDDAGGAGGTGGAGGSVGVCAGNGVEGGARAETDTDDEESDDGPPPLVHGPPSPYSRTEAGGFLGETGVGDDGGTTEEHSDASDTCRSSSPWNAEDSDDSWVGPPRVAAARNVSAGGGGKAYEGKEGIKGKEAKKHNTGKKQPPPGGWASGDNSDSYGLEISASDDFTNYPAYLPETGATGAAAGAGAGTQNAAAPTAAMGEVGGEDGGGTTDSESTDSRSSMDIFMDREYDKRIAELEAEHAAHWAAVEALKESGAAETENSAMDACTVQGFPYQCRHESARGVALHNLRATKQKITRLAPTHKFSDTERYGWHAEKRIEAETAAMGISMKGFAQPAPGWEPPATYSDEDESEEVERVSLPLSPEETAVLEEKAAAAAAALLEEEDEEEKGGAAGGGGGGGGKKKGKKGKKKKGRRR